MRIEEQFKHLLEGLQQYGESLIHIERIAPVHVDEEVLAEETASADSAQLLIDLYRGGAAVDDQLYHPNYKENRYLQATEEAIVKIHGSIQCDGIASPLQLNEAQNMIHAYPELEPNIMEIINNPNYAVKIYLNPQSKVK